MKITAPKQLSTAELETLREDQQVFTAEQAMQKKLAALATTDAEMARVVEDIWEIVKARTGATDDDLPESARNKINNRKEKRMS